jgi:hypothetical protein
MLGHRFHAGHDLGGGSQPQILIWVWVQGGVYYQEFPLDYAECGKVFQEPPRPFGQNLPRPEYGPARCPAEVDGLFQAGGGAIMIASHREHASLADQLNAFIGIRVIAHYIAQADDPICAAALYMGDHGRERLEI